MNPRLMGAAAALVLLTSCNRPLATSGIAELRGAPNIVKLAAEPGSHWRAYKLRAFQVNHIWGGTGYAPGGDKWANYRAKITLWDDDPHESEKAVAEIFFRDPEQLATPEPRLNPDPSDPKDPNNQNAQGNGPGRTYRLHFPSSTLDSVLQTLRFTNGDTYLYYYDNQWAVGIVNAEVIGSN